jgi:hypothetical protein
MGNWSLRRPLLIDSPFNTELDFALDVSIPDGSILNLVCDLLKETQ